MFIRKMLFYGREFWPVVTEDVQRLVTAASGMMRWICDVSLKDRIPTADLLLPLGLNSVNEILGWNRLAFHGHLIRMDGDTCPKKATMH